MHQFKDNSIDVLIVGAGPAGLMLACQLAIHKIPFRIIDKNNFSSKNSGALVLQARTLEIFEQMGIADEALSQGVISTRINIISNGKKISSTGIGDLGGSLSKFPFLLMLEQSQTEKILLKFIEDRGYSVEREVQLQYFSQQDGRVTSKVILGDNSELIISSKYIIAADGVNSTIRNLLNIPFEGKSYPNSIFILDCKAESELIADEISFAFSNYTVTGFFPIKGSRWRIDSNIPPNYDKQQKITFDIIKKNFQKWTKMNIQVQSPEWFSVTRSHQKYAASIQSQNCFLIGDAAHVHTPVGAQGMNTGIQDAFNLAWKMAFVIQNRALPALVETYSSERLGISKGFARYADLVFRVLTSGNRGIRLFRSTILRSFFTLLFPLISKNKTFRLSFFRSISQININYRASILAYRLVGFAIFQDSPKSGDRFPYIKLIDKEKNGSIYDKMNPVSLNLIVLSDSLPEEFNKIAEQFNLTVLLIPNIPETESIYTQLGIKKKGYYLIRPDMYIALKSRTLDVIHLRGFIDQNIFIPKD
jgi:2-polyprenyl-6-methoxyphenol hydroxylase-like FAD-dependent oxidoreductase